MWKKLYVFLNNENAIRFKVNCVNTRRTYLYLRVYTEYVIKYVKRVTFTIKFEKGRFKLLNYGIQQSEYTTTRKRLSTTYTSQNC